MTQRYALNLHCPDRVGIVHAVSGFLVARNCNILSSDQFDAEETKRFYLRVSFEALTPGVPLSELQAAFAPVATSFAMDWEMHDLDRPMRAFILVSKFDHCLHDILYRWRAGALPIDIVAVASNHRDTYRLVASYEIPFHHVPAGAETKAASEAEIEALAAKYGAELIVLARYMQVLSPAFCAKFPGRLINIHHSFLPSFKGARPYAQAHQRGVKLIGATAHYVTADLDDGPIIEQDVARVDHRATPERMAAIGRDVEAQVLARAVRYHAEHRVMLNGGKTIVFP